MSEMVDPVQVMKLAKEKVLISRLSPSSVERKFHQGEIYFQYENLLSFSNTESCVDALIELKQFVLEHGIPESNEYGADSLRSKVWKLLLGVPLYYDIDQYIKKYEVIY